MKMSVSAVFVVAAMAVLLVSAAEESPHSAPSSARVPHEPSAHSPSPIPKIHPSSPSPSPVPHHRSPPPPPLPPPSSPSLAFPPSSGYAPAPAPTQNGAVSNGIGFGAAGFAALLAVAVMA